ncbi:unnamed protein product [Gordionus sp. m RMFG-2023]
MPIDCSATFLVVQGLSSNASAAPYYSAIAVGTLDTMTGVITAPMPLVVDTPLMLLTTTITRTAVTAPYKGVFIVESITFSEGATANMGVCLILTASGVKVGAKVFISSSRAP